MCQALMSSSGCVQSCCFEPMPPNQAKIPKLLFLTVTPHPTDPRIT